jgi:unsaturated rhamnogalacturonyl hydrolase
MIPLKSMPDEGYRRFFSRNNLRPADSDKSWFWTQCSSVSGLGFKNAAGRDRDGSFDYYVSEPIVKNDLKGVGPFILAGIEMQPLAGGKK